MEVDSHIGTAMSGLIADARTLVDHARIEAQNHRFTYNEPMRTEALVQGVCDLMLSFGESGDEKKMSRPFGVALLVAGCDDTGESDGRRCVTCRSRSPTALINHRLATAAPPRRRRRQPPIAAIRYQRFTPPRSPRATATAGPKLFFCDPSGTYVEYKAKAIGSGSEGAQSQLLEEYSDDISVDEAELLAIKTLKAVMEEKIANDNVEVARVDATGYNLYSAEAITDLIGRIPV